MIDDLAKILVTEEQIRERTAALGKEITRIYQDEAVDELIIICITNGSVFFCADLLRHLKLYVQLDCVRVSSYRDETKPVTEPEIIDHIRLEIEGRHVLLLDDILDTGRTLRKIKAVLNSLKPASLRTAVLLDKEGRRTVDFTPDFTGFSIPDEFVVGYGLDFAEHYRNLPCIGVLKPEMQNPPTWR